MVGVRIVPFKDGFFEPDGTTPDRWASNYGTYANFNIGTVSSVKKLRHTGTDGGVVAPADNGTLRGTIGQTQRLYFDYTINLGAPGGTCYFIFFASTNTGTYLGDSYAYYITATDSYLYESTANVLTELAHTVQAHTPGVDYEIIIDYDPSTGVFTITENGATIVSYTDPSPLTGGSYIGINALNDVDISAVRVRRPWEEDLVSLSVIQRLTKAISTFNMKIQTADIGEGGTSAEWQNGDGIEIILHDGTTENLDFYGRVERITDSGDQGNIEIQGSDWRSEGIVTENTYSSGANLISDIIRNIVVNKLQVLRDGGIKATSETPVARTLQGKYAYNAIIELAQEAGYSVWQTPEGELKITDTYPASGITIIGDEIAGYKMIEESRDVVTSVKVGYAGGGSYTYEDDTLAAFKKCGRHEKIIIDKSIPDATQAAARGNYWINRYGAVVKVIDVWCTDFHELKIGETGTVTIGQLGITAQNFLCLEKEYDVPNGLGIRFRLQVTTGTPIERHHLNLGDKLGKVSTEMQQSLAQTGDTGGGVTAHTSLTDKEITGVIDHADNSVTDAKIAPHTTTKITVPKTKLSGVFPLGTSDYDDNSVTDAKIAAHTTTKITVPTSKVSADAALNMGGFGITNPASYDAWGDRGDPPVADFKQNRSSGTNTGITANKLVDAAADFVTDAVFVGDWVHNTTDNTWAQVTAIDDLNTLSLDADIFPAPVGDNYQIDDFRTDANWRDLDLSGIIGAVSKLVLLRVAVNEAVGNKAFYVRKNGNANTINVGTVNTQLANRWIYSDVWVMSDSDGVIEYKGSNATFAYIYVSVGGNIL